MTMLKTSWANVLGLLGVLALALGCGGCTQLHGGPQDGTETGNPPVVSPTLNSARVALVISADQVRVTGQAGAASPAGATVEVISALTGARFQATVAADGSFDVSVSGSKLDSYEVRVVAEDEASSNSVYVAPGAAAVASASDGGALSCKQREELAHQQLEAVAVQASMRTSQNCRIDSDCTEAFTGSVCNDSCSRYAVSNLQAQDIQAARDAIEGGLCKTYKQDGCQFIVQPCPQVPGEVACIGGVRCALVTPDGPDCADKPVCVNGARQIWPKVCEQSVTEQLSASVGVFCIADDQGNVGLTIGGASMAVTNKGWSSSQHGQVRNTLSPDAQAKCDAQRAALGVDLNDDAAWACIRGTP